MKRISVFALCTCALALIAGCTSTSGPDDPPPDTEPPTVRITYPPNNAVIGDEVTITAEASDSRSVAAVEFHIDGAVAHVDTTFPYEFAWDASAEQTASVHSIRAKARDEANNEGGSPVRAVHCRWRYLIQDGNEYGDRDIDCVYVRSTATMIEFRVATHGTWEDPHDPVAGINVGILLDVDQDQSTGLNEFIPGWCPPIDIGADFGAGVGYEGDHLWVWDAVDTLWLPCGDYAYASVPHSSRRFDVGILLSGIGDPWVIDIVVVNSLEFWDWAPDSGHATYTVDGLYVGGDSLPERSSPRPAPVPRAVRGPLWHRVSPD